MKTDHRISSAVVIVLWLIWMPTVASPIANEAIRGNPPRASTPTYIFHRGGLSEGRIPYESALISLIIERSTPKYGPAKIDFLDRPMTAFRARNELQTGKIVHFQTGALINKTIDEATVIVIRKPILKSLLGYRQVIVRRERLPEFRTVKNWNQLYKLSGGQAAHWPDVKVLEANNLKVVKGDNYQSLFPMLHHRRFDYLPLGTGEVHESLAAQKELVDELAVVETFILYYPWPIYFLVSKTQPVLAERLTYAMDLIIQNGEFDALFKLHFSDTIERISSAEMTTFVLTNPDIAADDPLVSPILSGQSHIALP